MSLQQNKLEIHCERMKTKRNEMHQHELNQRLSTETVMQSYMLQSCPKAVVYNSCVHRICIEHCRWAHDSAQ